MGGELGLVISKVKSQGLLQIHTFFYIYLCDVQSYLLLLLEVTLNIQCTLRNWRGKNYVKKCKNDQIAVRGNRIVNTRGAQIHTITVLEPTIVLH